MRFCRRIARIELAFAFLIVFTASFAAAQTITEFPITTPNSEPGGITLGPDGNLWFTEFGVGQIGRITTGGTVTEFTAAGNPQLIVVGSDNHLWFAETTVNRIGHMSTSGAFGDFPVINPDPSLVGIAAGSDGNLWFCEAGPGNVGRITTGGMVTEFPVNGFPLQITAGSDGNLWYAEFDGAAIGRLTTSGAAHDFPTGVPGSAPQGITLGPDGNIWFTDTGANQIGRITTTGVVSEFPIPTPNTNLLGIATGPDGNLWFAEDYPNQIGRITLKGVVTEFPIPTSGAGPVALVVGPDGNLWFTEVEANQIGRVTMSSLAAETASVDTHSVTGSSSNMNGVFEPGETVEVSPAWHNTAAGAQSVSGTAAILTGPAGPTYTVVDASANYGSIAGGGTADCHDATGDCYLLKISGARPVAHWDAVLTETLNGSTTTWARTIHLGNSFADVPTTYPFYAFIESLFHSGATGGCGGGLFCPLGTVTRAQMAVFLLKGKHGANYVPPACSGEFADVPCPSQFADWIEQFSAEGITAGCGGGDYCPNQPVTRAQMAVFLLKAEHGSAYMPPACSGEFLDVPCPSQYANWVEQLHAENITAGCGGGNYCPNDPNIRGQMAVFLVKIFSLQLYGA